MSVDPDAFPASLFLAGDDVERSGAGALVGDTKKRAKYDAPSGEPCPHCGHVVDVTDPYQVIARHRWHQRCNDEKIRQTTSASIQNKTHSTTSKFPCEYCGELSVNGHYSVSWQDRKYMCPDCAKKNGETVPEHLLRGFVPFDPATMDGGT